MRLNLSERDLTSWLIKLLTKEEQIFQWTGKRKLFKVLKKSFGEFHLIMKLISKDIYIKWD
jgi:hypothetical protein